MRLFAMKAGWVRLRGGAREAGVRLYREETAQTLAVAAICLVMLLGLAGLGVDVGRLTQARRQLQLLADAAAQAGALEVPKCNGTAGCPAMLAGAKSAVTENGVSAPSMLANCAAGTGTTLELTVNNPPCALGAADTFVGHLSAVEAVVSQPQPMTFAHMVGLGSVMMKARGEAVWKGPSNCVYSLNPSGLFPMTVDANAQVKSSCGLITESTSVTGAFLCLAGASVTAPLIQVNGLISLLCTTSVPVTSGLNPVPTDPLSGVPAPSRPACGSSVATPYHGSPTQLTIVGTATLYPDATYCGGIYIQPTAHVTFQPGTYVLTSRNGVGVTVGLGGLSIPTGATVTGSGVTFYNYGPIGPVTVYYSLYTSGGVQLTAPSSGTYAGVLVFQDPQDVVAGSYQGNAAWNTVLQGAIYEPSAKVAYAYSGASAYNPLVAKDIEFQVYVLQGVTLTSVFTNNYNSLLNGSPLAGTGTAAVLE